MREEFFTYMCNFKKAHIDRIAFLCDCQSAKNAGSFLVKATIFRHFQKVCQLSIDNGACFVYIVLSTEMCIAHKKKDGDEHEIFKAIPHK